MVDPTNEKKERVREREREGERGWEKKKDFSALQPDIKGRF